MKVLNDSKCVGFNEFITKNLDVIPTILNIYAGGINKNLKLYLNLYNKSMIILKNFC